MSASPNQMTPETRRWRVGLLSLCAIVFLLCFFDFLNCSPLLPLCGVADFGLDLSYSTGWMRVNDVTAGGPGSVAGLRVGDRIDSLHETTFRERWLLRNIRNAGWLPRNGNLHIAIHRGKQQSTTFIQPRPIGTWADWIALTGWEGVVLEASLLWLLIFGALLVSRRPGLPQARLLAIFLLALIAGGTLSGSTVPWWPHVDLALLLLSHPLSALSITAIALFAATFARPLSRARRFLTITAIGLAILGATLLSAFYTRFYLLALPGQLVYVGGYVIGGAYLLALVCMFAALIAATGAERQRAIWATTAIGPLLAVLGFWNAITLTDQAGFVSQTAADAVTNATSLFAATMPVGLTYAVLSRRVIDTGYVINRTAIFAAISIIVLGIFVLVEWALGSWVGNVSHATDMVVNIVVALALGLSIRTIHRRVDHVIDRVFFRKRHENETALRRFAHEATFITDTETLLDRTVEEVKEHAELDRVEILVQNGAGTYDVARGNGATASENDPAIVAMRAWHQPVDLQRYQTVVDGDRAFPLLARGRMLGVLVCGSRNSREPYAPDEADALVSVAHGVGIALDGLRDGRSDSPPQLQETLDQIRADLRILIQRSDGQVGTGKTA